MVFRSTPSKLLESPIDIKNKEHRIGPLSEVRFFGSDGTQNIPPRSQEKIGHLQKIVEILKNFLNRILTPAGARARASSTALACTTTASSTAARLATIATQPPPSSGDVGLGGRQAGVEWRDGGGLCCSSLYLSGTGWQGGR
jgi:hypothetical protein